MPSMPFDLSRFGLGEMLRCSAELKDVARDATSMGQAAEALVRYFRGAFLMPHSSEPACPLVRFYRTRDFGKLAADEQAFAGRLLDGAPAAPSMKCLQLLATAGDEPEWNSPAESRGHRAVPLPSVEMVRQAPMIAALIEQLGLDLADVLTPSPVLLRALEGKTYNVFHVEDARGSPYIPAQAEFVVPYRVRSVVGFGGLLASGDLFAVILFSRLHVSHESADLFRFLALDVKGALFPFRRE